MVLALWHRIWERETGELNSSQDMYTKRPLIALVSDFHHRHYRDKLLDTLLCSPPYRSQKGAKANQLAEAVIYDSSSETRQGE